MDYSFNEEFDIRLIALFIADSFKTPVPEAYIVDILMLVPVINYFDMTCQLAALCDEHMLESYCEADARFYRLTDKGREALSFFASRIPKTVRERLLRAIKLKIKEHKNALSVKAECSTVSDIEYNVSLGISEGPYELFSVSIAVGDKALAHTMCNSFKKDPQKLYNEIVSLLVDKQ